MLQPKHKGRGRWVVVDGEREVAGPFPDKPEAEAYIAAQPVAAPSGAASAMAVAPEAKAAADHAVAEKARLQAKRGEYLSERESSKRTQEVERSRTEALYEDLRAVILKHAGEDAAYRCEQELRQIAADPKREARRRQRLREAERHGGDMPLPRQIN